MVIRWLEAEENYKRYLRMDTKIFQARFNGFLYFINTYGGHFGAVVELWESLLLYSRETCQQ